MLTPALLASSFPPPSSAGLPTSLSSPLLPHTPASISPTLSTPCGLPTTANHALDNMRPNQSPSLNPEQDLGILLAVMPLSHRDSHLPFMPSLLPAGQLDHSTHAAADVPRRSEWVKTKPYEKLKNPTKVANKCPSRGVLPPKKLKKPKQKNQAVAWVLWSTPHFQMHEDLEGLIALLGSAESTAVIWVQEISQTYVASSVDVHSLRSIAEQCHNLDRGMAADNEPSALCSIVGQCRDLQKRTIYVDFAFMISCIRLTLKCQR
ncbi:hypothetical protein JVT61DRAFT_9559 [Boletus reticuloceps]|uniref:Uncharacterized protein n=1 Tax=Boletus reticuloceps TaxID=495285 RepID=A0A8I3A531_9AGAM|nr:hypothetical protein JVT61DRAFT_9559 [Boletus reticuloceps]